MNTNLDGLQSLLDTLGNTSDIMHGIRLTIDRRPPSVTDPDRPAPTYEATLIWGQHGTFIGGGASAAEAIENAVSDAVGIGQSLALKKRAETAAIEARIAKVETEIG